MIRWVLNGLASPTLPALLPQCIQILSQAWASLSHIGRKLSLGNNLWSWHHICQYPGVFWSIWCSLLALIYNAWHQLPLAITPSISHLCFRLFQPRYEGLCLDLLKLVRLCVCYHWKTCSFLKGNVGVVNLGEERRWQIMGRGEREEAVFNVWDKNKEKESKRRKNIPNVMIIIEFTIQF